MITKFIARVANAAIEEDEIVISFCDNEYGVNEYLIL